MDTSKLLESVPGAQELVDWFSYWPSFHDAEVLSLSLNRTGESCVKVHTFRMTDALSPSGHYICDKHVIVSILMNEITGFNLEDFSDQNVLSWLDLAIDENGVELTLGGCYGLQGRIRSKSIRVAIEPGTPAESVYAQARHL